MNVAGQQLPGTASDRQFACLADHRQKVFTFDSNGFGNGKAALVRREISLRFASVRIADFMVGPEPVQGGRNTSKMGCGPVQARRDVRRSSRSTNLIIRSSRMRFAAMSLSSIRLYVAHRIRSGFSG